MATTPVKVQDVAREAGVSRATVSYVLNGRRDVRVSEATRERVMKVARSIGYIGSPAARALRSGRGDVVLLLIPGWEVGGQLELLLEELGRRVALLDLVCLRYEGAKWQGSLHTVLSRIPAACVVTFDPLGEDDQQALDSVGIPEVAARLLDRPGLPHTTAIGQGAIVAAQIDHMLSQGYRDLGYLAVEEPLGAEFTKARVEAFGRLCSARGVTDARSTIVPPELAAITDTVNRWYAASSGPLGIVAWNDITGLAVISAATTLGLSVPTQLGVIGGDETPVAAMTHPPLSSVRFNLQSEATGIANQVAVALGQAADAPDAQVDAVAVIPRQSTARSASDAR
jgi:DNA-binding LacI/PurR family transcriptional regulator